MIRAAIILKPAGRIDRRAFTIFELIIVMALLVTIVGLLWPALDNLHTEYRLRQAGQLVQARMAGARVHAIDWGMPWQFRYEPGGQRFIVVPYDQQSLYSQTNAAKKPPRVAGVLPSTRASFEAGGLLANGGQSVDPGWFSGMPNAEDFSGVAWSAPLVFHPDGTSGAARVVIRDKNSRIVTVSVRALTGGVTVSKIEKGGTP